MIRPTAILCILLAAPLCQAVTAYDNFGYEGGKATFDYEVSWPVDGGGVYSDEGYLIDRSDAAALFTSRASGRVSFIDLALFSVLYPGGFQISVLADNDHEFGACLATWTIDNATCIDPYTEPYPTDYLPVRTTPNSLVLAEGTNYWILIEASVPQLYAGWNLNDQGDQGYVAQCMTGLDRNYFQATMPAFRVEVEAVPEPFTLLIASAALAAAWRRRATRQKR